MANSIVQLSEYTAYADGSVHGNDPGALLDQGATLLAKMPPVIAHPRPDAETTTEYVYRNAYPGMLYEMPCAVQGGMWPFTYTLTGAPAGMTIGTIFGASDYGIIRWTNPVLGAANGITVTVTDADGTIVTSLFSVLCSTAKFSFFDITNGNDTTGDGSIGNPYASFRAWDSTGKNSAALSGQIAVHRAGTYATSNLSPVFEDGVRYAMGANKPKTFMGYPGEITTIDFSQARMSFYLGDSNDVAFHNLNFNGYNTTIHRLVEHWSDRLSAYKISYDHVGAPAGIEGQNASIFFLGGSASGMDYSSITHSDFSNLNAVSITTTYDVRNGVFADNTINNCNRGLYIKLGNNNKISLRNNSGAGNTGVVLRVDNYPQVTDIEMCFNNLQGSAALVAWGPEAITQTGRWEYRNTFRTTGGAAPIRVENSGATSFLSESSVIEHTSAVANGIDEDYSAFYSGVYTKNNLELSDTGVTYTDAAGLLVGAYRTQYLNTRGHEVVV